MSALSWVNTLNLAQEVRVMSSADEHDQNDSAGDLALIHNTTIISALRMLFSLRPVWSLQVKAFACLRLIPDTSAIKPADRETFSIAPRCIEW
ncbi:MAG: hypothetical protein RL417_381 [Pseudomonadota bacterium]